MTQSSDIGKEYDSTKATSLLPNGKDASITGETRPHGTKREEVRKKGQAIRMIAWILRQYILLVGREHGSAREHVGISWRGLFGSDIGQ